MKTTPIIASTDFLCSNWLFLIIRYIGYVADEHQSRVGGGVVEVVGQG